MMNFLLTAPLRQGYEETNGATKARVILIVRARDRQEAIVPEQVPLAAMLWDATGGRILGRTNDFDASPQQSDSRRVVALIDAANAKRARKMERRRKQHPTEKEQ